MMAHTQRGGTGYDAPPPRATTPACHTGEKNREQQKGPRQRGDREREEERSRPLSPGGKGSAAPTTALPAPRPPPLPRLSCPPHGAQPRSQRGGGRCSPPREHAARVLSEGESGGTSLRVGRGTKLRVRGSSGNTTRLYAFLFEEWGGEWGARGGNREDKAAAGRMRKSRRRRMPAGPAASKNDPSRALALARAPHGPLVWQS